NSHSSVSHAIKSGLADMGIGLIAAAAEKRLDFIPLFEEQNDLVFTEEQFQKEYTQMLLDLLASGEYRKSINNLTGYSTRRSGRITEVKINNEVSIQS
ncbi:MAG: hypothetical protein JSW42_14455, partial [Chloroflexota bacterium]